MIGKKKISEAGLKVVGGHTDAPRLDLKPRPLYEKGGYVYFDCHIYGGIKKYQWLVLPLALYGTVVRKDGKKIDIAVGDAPGDPVFMISDILPHLGKDQAKQTRDEFFPAEDLDVVAWTTYAKPGKDAKPGDEPKAGKSDFVAYLKKTYKIDEDDLLSAELEIVPAGMPREVGFDRALIAGYGHDDRVCSFAGLQALIDASDHVPDVTASILMCDKEEVGSMGITGMISQAFEHFMNDMCKGQGVDLYDCFAKSFCLSADVTAALDPNFMEVFEANNESRVNHGIAICKYTGGRGKGGASDANAETVAYVRKIFTENGVLWQLTEMGKIDEGGGGTVALDMANRNIETIDAGVPVLSMHAPFEVVAKLDCYMTYKGCKAVFEAK